MSSCCTLRLKRRNAFSRDSPSCNLTSANGNDTPKLVQVDWIVIARFCPQVKAYVEASQSKQPLKLAFCVLLRLADVLLKLLFLRVVGVLFQLAFRFVIIQASLRTA